MTDKKLIIRLSKTGKYTLQEIADKCECTRQNVHLILKKRGLINKKAKKVKYPIQGFKNEVFYWCRKLGWYHCFNCKQWFDKDAFGKSTNVCKICAYKRERARYLKDPKKYNAQQRKYRFLNTLEKLGIPRELGEKAVKELEGGGSDKK